MPGVARPYTGRTRALIADQPARRAVVPVLLDKKLQTWKQTYISSGPLVAAPPPLLGQVGSVLLALTRELVGSRHRERQLVPTL